MQNTTIPTPSFAWADTIQPAADLLNRRPRSWIGHSGETITGPEVAAHLDAVADLLTTAGWVRTYTDTTDRITIPDPEGMSVPAMLRTLLRTARQLLGRDDPRRTLWSAMYQTGDTDTAHVAGNVLAAILRARTGASGPVSYTSWAERPHRTGDDIAQLLATGADLAHQHGPTT
ncbi:hypothetical protein LUW75_10780 [Streptomyces sp. MRC013]|uniref:DUF6197 family protein n=1 Tax=Streptomyces sp. MRC013 TaxID=2898276 RepID=UPI002026EA5D|nr:hypothetical protein [Streptomyces sp. MRC013]URM90398.1 hypothetical protein LUW75_10780 [Streptomyces sp. MRC013]